MPVPDVSMVQVRSPHLRVCDFSRIELFGGERMCMWDLQWQVVKQSHFQEHLGVPVLSLHDVCNCSFEHPKLCIRIIAL